jgi:hypothetical protein
MHEDDGEGRTETRRLVSELRLSVTDQREVEGWPEIRRDIAGDMHLRRRTTVNVGGKQTSGEEGAEGVQGTRDVTRKMKAGSVWSEEDEGDRN